MIMLPVNTAQIRGIHVSTLHHNSEVTSWREAPYVVKGLELLSYGVEGRHKARAWRVRGWALPRDDWKAVSVNPAVNGYLFRITEG